MLKYVLLAILNEWFITQLTSVSVVVSYLLYSQESEPKYTTPPTKPTKRIKTSAIGELQLTVPSLLITLQLIQEMNRLVHWFLIILQPNH